MDLDAEVEGVSMAKAKTYFPQVPVEIAKRVAAAESDGRAAELLKTLKKSPNGHAPADHKADG